MPLTASTKQKFKAFENIVSRTICSGPVFNNNKLNCIKEENRMETREMTKVSLITSYAKGQKSQWVWTRVKSGQ